MQRSESIRYWLATGVGTSLALLSLFVFARPAATEPANPPITPDQATFFENKVRPLLSASCYSCHGKDAQLGGLRVDSREALLKGGVTGTSLVPGDPAKSLLITAIHQTTALKMPQGGKLKPEEIATLDAWVKMGAPWPQTPAAPGAGDEANPTRGFWSLQPVRNPALPRVKNKAWAKTPLDSFVLAQLEAKGLAPAPAADRRTLLRRVTFDLTGLPPTPSEMEAFQSDKSPNAYREVVDRLLASPRYGERWGRLWLDVARYSDTKGYVFVEDRNYPHAYTFRDWVIESLNEDLPYDKFVTDQLAADLLPEVKSGDDKRPLAALGFLTVGRRFLNNQPDIMDDRIDVTMRGFEGLTVACARCHDHKFDPIPTADYYSLYGVFASTQETTPAISPRNISAPYEIWQTDVNATQNASDDLLRAEIKRLRDQQTKDGATPTLAEPVRKALQAVRENDLPKDDNLMKLVAAFTPQAKAKYDELNKKRDALKASAPTTPELAMAVTDAAQPMQPYIFKRGNQGNHGDEVPRRFLRCLSPVGKPRDAWAGSGRLELARAITSTSNPLTARVFVNRVWMHHFGNGIVRTPSDFGKQGERPTHPELLDYLASRFMADGWSIKKLQRMIVLSATYRQESVASDRSLQVDPENRLLSHQNRHRLDLEEMRDSLVWASGKLDTSKVGGPSVQLWDAPYTDRRAVYGFVERQNLPGTFRTFDFATPDATSAKRFQTTIPQQALFLMNSPFAVQQATLLADRPDFSTATATDEARSIRRVYLRLFDRLPDPDELKAGNAYLHAPDPDADAPLAPAAAWRYGYGGFDAATQRTAGFTPFARFEKDHYQVGAVIPDPMLGYVSLTADGGHPGHVADQSAIRRWTAPADMTVSVAGTLRHPSDQGDGVHGRVVSSRSGLAGEWVAQHGETSTTVAKIAVRKGDTLDFIVDCRASDNSDSFQWAPILRRVGASTDTWNASQEFAGPNLRPDRHLTRWERYAQALLMTNEFLFVD